MSIAINLKSLTNSISDRTLEKLCTDNPEVKFETTKEGKLIVMSPTGSESGRKNGRLFGQVWNWNEQTQLGVVFDSSTGFKLSNGATRSPDVSWIELSRWNSLTPKQQRGFAPIDPDFVIELMSPTDNLEELQQKMSEYIACGVKLGWLINPDDQQVEIYRAEDTKVLNNPQSLFGENLMPNLIINLSGIL